jgi:transcriptional regulator with XRE-family HTH domain
MLDTFLLKLPKEIMLELAQRVRQMRREKKISSKVMSERSGVSLGSIKRFETTGKISLESLLMIALVLNRLDDFEKLFHKDDAPKTIDDLFK